MIGQEAIENTILRGLAFLKKKQFKDGGFPCETAQSINCTNESMENFEERNSKGWVEKDDHSVYPSAITGLSLLYLQKYPDAELILKGISGFLTQNMCRFGVWNNFTRQHPWYPFSPFDVDNTSCASVFLTARGISYPDNKTSLLSLKNREGLFFTWFTFRWSWNTNPVYWYYVIKEMKNPVKSYMIRKYFECDRDDVDAIVNNNLLLYFGVVKETQPIIDNLVRVILEGKELECDKWYLDPISIYYFISKNLEKGIPQLEPVKIPIKERILAGLTPEGSYGGNSLETAFAICALLSMGFYREIPKASIQYLLEKQKTTGAWERRLFMYGGPKRIMGWGSEELTTSICLEAISRYKDLSLVPENSK
jgi:hypothetical protein